MIASKSSGESGLDSQRPEFLLQNYLLIFENRKLWFQRRFSAFVFTGEIPAIRHGGSN
jgi:hypothetical protein